MKTTIENNIKKLVEKGLISVQFPKMGGVMIVNGIKFDKREYYSGRGSKFNKNINHEKVVIRITQKEIAKAIRLFKGNEAFKKTRNAAIKKALSKSNPWQNRNLYGTFQHAYTESRGLYFPVQKEIERTKI